MLYNQPSVYLIVQIIHRLGHLSAVLPSPMSFKHVLIWANGSVVCACVNSVCVLGLP